VPISRGAIQRTVDQVSEAVRPHYEAIATQARTVKINYIDETAWYQHGVLTWLWVMVNTTVALFAVQSSRSREAFERLVERWAGILVSDGYGVYCQWLHGRQTCRKATDWMVLIIALVSSWGECEQGKQLIFQR
jgi:transposase